ncbi:MAG TPA: hypothetical protein VGH94_08315 [Acidimicrobiales bacterium]|jgi:hypothetical protein
MRRMLARLLVVGAVLAPTLALGSPALAGPANPGDVRNCSDFASYNAAWVWYETYKPSFGDVAHLDSDGNGYPCETLANPPVDAPSTLSLGAGATDFPTFGPGYWMLEANGSVFGFGSAFNLKGTTGTQTAGQGPFRPYAGAVVAAAQGRMLGPALSGQRTFYESLCILDETGLRFGHGTLPCVGSAAQPITANRDKAAAVAYEPNGTGGWVFTRKGAVYPWGSAGQFGDMTSYHLNGEIIAAAPTPSGHGYYMIGSDGGVFSFGDAAFHGSMGGIPLNQAVVGVAPDPDGSGYWLVAADGGIFAFDASFRGSVPGALAAGRQLNRPVIGAVAYGKGYLMVASDGGIFSFSDQPFLGSLGATPPPNPIVAVIPRASGGFAA